MFTFTSKDKAEAYLQYLKGCEDSDEDEEDEPTTMWCIKSHVLNPDADCIEDEHYDLETLQEQN